MKPVVFAGPSIFGLAPGHMDGMDMRPPAARGDILRAFEGGARVIGLIDGYFDAAPAVWHKEILFALEGGCLILGAASMGALRAAECDTFGMMGVGKIYQDYASGARVSDADVAVTHAPAELGYQPLTVAQVDAEDVILSAFAQEVIPAGIRDDLLQASAALHYKERTWGAILNLVDLEEAQKSRFQADLPCVFDSLKRRDAEALLTVIRQNHSADGPVPERNWQFQHTLFFRDLQNGVL
ncbi:TfuA-like protein [Roseibium sp. RKSG952]|uniref:TfuA-like protein n=1 Tax=Roseibium sp. RKSG952 TaxID=2529384 RepID=UPI0012BC7499|nr:TfuA-like protein [Roseibium sp. RKSG952]MTI00381.1 TfuA-like core domain-containing protein [Roseibium sp. RKSG952]